MYCSWVSRPWTDSLFRERLIRSTFEMTEQQLFPDSCELARNRGLCRRADRHPDGRFGVLLGSVNEDIARINLLAC